MDSTPVIVLDVGGTCFRTTKTTLASIDSFFSRMVSESWREGSGCDTSHESAETPRGKHGSSSSSSSSSSSPGQHRQQQQPAYIFIDRDPTCFPAILSFLRSQQAFLHDCDRAYLDKLLCEADYYQLDALAACVRQEMEKREARRVGQEGDEEDETVSSSDVYRAVQPSEVHGLFEQGWAFVSSYEANETAACSATGSKVTAQWRNNMCSVCGFTMTYDKFVKHASFFKPTVVVLRKPKRGSGAAHSLSLMSQLSDLQGTGLGGWGGSVFAPSRLVVGPEGLLSPVSAGGHGHGGMGMGGMGGMGVGAVPFAGFGQAGAALDVDASFG